VTSDVERAAVLWQNEMLREHYRTANPGLFQKLRRCCICLQSSCSDQSACRAEFETWTQKRWDRSVEAELDRRDPHRGPYVRVAEDGTMTPCTHDGKPLP
jgi:hypothetical protein